MLFRSGVARLKEGVSNLVALLELHFMHSRDPVVVQQFLPAVSKGDKRVLLVDGEPVGAINRIFGFLILAIAVQLVWDGVAEFKQ